MLFLQLFYHDLKKKDGLLVLAGFLLNQLDQDPGTNKNLKNKLFFFLSQIFVIVDLWSLLYFWVYVRAFVLILYVLFYFKIQCFAC